MRKSSGTRQAARARTSTRIARGDREHGEGNYKAARKYDEAVARFARSGKVARAARAARPRSHREAAEMERAEARGKSRSKGEDGGTARR
jgi:hypothetical protein